VKNKIKIIFKCNKCGKLQPKDEKQSNKNWFYYQSDQECDCGGKFEMKLE